MLRKLASARTRAHAHDHAHGIRIMFGKPADGCDGMACDDGELTGLEWLHAAACVSPVRSLEVEGRRAVVLAK